MILRRLTRTGSWTVCWGKGRVRGCRVCVLRRGASGRGAGATHMGRGRWGDAHGARALGWDPR